MSIEDRAILLGTTMKIRRVTNISDIKKIWDRIYQSSDYSFFQSYEWNYALVQSYRKQRLTNPRELKDKKILFFVIDDRVIIPSIIDSGSKELYLLGEDKPSDYLSFVHDINDFDLLKKYVEYFVNTISGEVSIFHFNRIREDSLLSDVLIDLSNTRDRIKHHRITNVKIELDMNAPFYDSLSKSVRQNYRTAKNRIAKDGLDYHVKTYTDKIDKNHCDQLLELYLERSAEKYSEQKSDSVKDKVKRIVKSIVGYSINDVLSAYAKDNSVFCSEIYISGSLAAFCEGNISANSKEVQIARVAVKKDFYKYSPGMVLLIDTLEDIKHTYEVFDLTRGIEEYKYKLGGIDHYSNSFTVVS